MRLRYLIRKEQDFKQLLNYIDQVDIFGIDTETNGKWSQFELNLVGISIGFDDFACYIPLTHVTHMNQLDMSYVLDGLRPILESPSSSYVFHNAKFDEKVFKIYGINCQGTGDDTYVLSWLLHEEGSHGLKQLTQKYLGIKMDTYEDVINRGKKRRGIARDYDFANVSLKDALSYAADDAYYTLRLYRIFREGVERENLWQPYINIERPLLRVLRDIELRGILIDREYLDHAAKRYPELMEEIESEVLGDIGEPINIDSGKQLGIALFETLKIGKTPVKTRTGQYKTDKKALEKYAAKYPVVEKILRRKKIKKTYDVFVEGLIPHIQNNRVYANFNSCGTVTGRFSCIAEGSLVDCPRDLVKYPRGVPIQDVKEGQLVYSFGEDGQPRVQRVLSKRFTGYRKVVKLLWRGEPFNYIGELKLTPDHRVWSMTRGWVRADQLLPGEKLSFLNRSIDRDSYSILKWPNQSHKNFEHRVVQGFYNTGQGESFLTSLHVHHSDRSKLNNDISNLEVLTLQEHLERHWLEDRNQYTKLMPCPYTTSELEKILCKGIAAAMRETPHDYYSLIRWARERSVEYPDTRRGSVNEKEFIDLYDRGLAAVDLMKLTGLTNNGVYGRIYRLNKKRKLKAANHHVLAIADEGEVLPVWDLEIENTSNFIVNEIQVHNSSKPNMQQIQGDEIEEIRVRDFFQPTPGYVFVVGDFGQIELRVMAHYARDKVAIKAFESGRDFHSETARAMFSLPETAIPTTRQRFYAKALNFGIPYGRGPISVGETLAIKPYCRDHTCGDCAACFIDKWFSGFPSVAPYKDVFLARARQQGYMRTIAGRKRRLPELRAKDYKTRGAAERQAFNTLCQGSSADIIKLGMVKVAPKLKDLGAYILIQVHDELLTEAPIEKAEEVAKVLKETMEAPLDGANPLRLPLNFDPKIVNRWSQAK